MAARSSGVVPWLMDAYVGWMARIYLFAAVALSLTACRPRSNLSPPELAGTGSDAGPPGSGSDAPDGGGARASGDGGSGAGVSATSYPQETRREIVTVSSASTSRSRSVGPASAGLCWDGWCWESPTPYGFDLSSVGGVAADDLWYGSRHLVIHDTAGSLAPWGLEGDVRAIWAARHDDVWAVGATDAGVAFAARWDGQRWATEDLPAVAPLDAVWGSSGQDVWLGGGSGLLHWDGSRFTAVPLDGRGVVSLWASGPKDVFAAVSPPANPLHFDGTSWKQMTNVPGTFPVCAVAGSGPRDVWAVGNDNTVLHYDGRTWDRFAWFTVPYYDPQGEQYRRAAASSGGLWATGSYQFITYQGPDIGSSVHYAAPMPAPVNTKKAPYDVAGLWARGSDAVAVGGSGEMLRWTADEWSLQTRAPSADAFGGFFGGSSAGLWGSGADDLWAFGHQGGEYGTSVVLHRENGSWERVEPRGLSWLTGPVALSGTSAKDLWLLDAGVFRPELFHWNGSEWDLSVPLPVWLPRMTGLSVVAGRIFATEKSYDGVTRLVVLEGTTLREVSLPGGGNALAVWASSPGDAWIATDGPSLLHWDGQRLAVSRALGAPGSSKGFALFAASGRDDVWLIGSGTLHFDGSAWSEVRLPNGIVPSGAHATVGRAWFVDDRSVVSWDGVAFTSSRLSYPVQSPAIWSDAGGVVWLAHNGGILRSAP